ncbi:MAG TPA: hypothetical protein PK514_05705 [Spirochaetota bacterium]|nr:hypothetical protein [Spirochaetota bacterium]
MKPEYIILFFAVYSFTGWIIEIIYRSVTQGRLVNPGFLFGPFVPVYGIGALVIISIQSLISGLPIAAQFAVYFVLLTSVEFITGELFERFFELQLWDYSENRFNFKGKVCASFSCAWGVLAMGLAYLLHPFLSRYVFQLGNSNAVVISTLMVVYFITDLTASVVALNRFRENLRYLYDKYITLSHTEIDRILDSYKRLLGAFPYLYRNLGDNLSRNIKLKVSAAKGKMNEIAESVMSERRPDNAEYNSIVREILDNPEFMKLENFFHHNSSILEHAKVVSYIAYRVCKYFHMDYVSAARGGLLHDFFLYDWRNHDEPELHRDKYHGLEHPRIALENSLRYFSVNKVEKDIILKHMWPLTIVPPRYQESYIVTFVDKYVSSKEFIDEFMKRKDKLKAKVKGIGSRGKPAGAETL